MIDPLVLWFDTKLFATMYIIQLKSDIQNDFVRLQYILKYIREQDNDFSDPHNNTSNALTEAATKLARTAKRLNNYKEYMKNPKEGVSKLPLKTHLGYRNNKVEFTLEPEDGLWLLRSLDSTEESTETFDTYDKALARLRTVWDKAIELLQIESDTIPIPDFYLIHVQRYAKAFGHPWGLVSLRSQNTWTPAQIEQLVKDTLNITTGITKPFIVDSVIVHRKEGDPISWALYNIGNLNFWIDNDQGEPVITISSSLSPTTLNITTSLQRPYTRLHFDQVIKALAALYDLPEEYILMLDSVTNLKEGISS